MTFLMAILGALQGIRLRDGFSKNMTKNKGKTTQMTKFKVIVKSTDTLEYEVEADSEEKIEEILFEQIFQMTAELLTSPSNMEGELEIMKIEPISTEGTKNG